MATVNREVVIEPGDSYDRMRISWGGIWSGVLVVVGTLIVLSALGLAVGISVAQPTTPDPRAMGTGAAVWSSVSLLIALFLGGMVATRCSGPTVRDRITRLMQGTLVWVISIVAILYLAVNGIGLMLGTTFGLATSTAQGVTAIVSGATELATLSEGDVDQMLARLNDPQTASRIATTLGLPQDEVETALQNISERVQNAQQNPAQAAAEVRRGTADLLARVDQRIASAAAQVQPEATTTAWMFLLALVISLLAALAGSEVAGRRATKMSVAR